MSKESVERRGEEKSRWDRNARKQETVLTKPHSMGICSRNWALWLGA